MKKFFLRLFYGQVRRSVHFYFKVLDNRVFVKILSIFGTENAELKLHLCLPLSSISLYGSIHDDGWRMEKRSGVLVGPRLKAQQDLFQVRIDCSLMSRDIVSLDSEVH